MSYTEVDRKLDKEMQKKTFVEVEFAGKKYNLTEGDLWYAYIALYYSNRKKSTCPEVQKLSERAERKIYRIGKKLYGWA